MSTKKLLFEIVTQGDSVRKSVSVSESVIRGNFLQSRLLVQCPPGCVNTGNKQRMNSTTLQMKILLHAFIGPSCFQAQRMLFYTTSWACAVQQHSEICHAQATPNSIWKTWAQPWLCLRRVCTQFLRPFQLPICEEFMVFTAQKVLCAPDQS